MKLKFKIGDYVISEYNSSCYYQITDIYDNYYDIDVYDRDTRKKSDTSCFIKQPIIDFERLFSLEPVYAKIKQWNDEIMEIIND